MQTGLISLTQLTEPAQEIVELQDVINYVHSTGGEESFLSMLLSASRDIFESQLNRAFQTEKFQAIFELPYYYPDMGVMLPTHWTQAERVCTIPRPPLQSIDLVEIETEFDKYTDVDPTSYGVRTAIPAEVIMYATAYQYVAIGYFTQWRQPRIRISYTAGYTSIDDVPKRFQLMLLQIIAHNYLQRETIDIPTDLAMGIFSDKVLVL